MCLFRKQPMGVRIRSKIPPDLNSQKAPTPSQHLASCCIYESDKTVAIFSFSVLEEKVARSLYLPTHNHSLVSIKLRGVLLADYA